MNSYLKASIIIPFGAHKHLLKYTLRNINEQIGINKDEFEVILVKDGIELDIDDLIEEFKPRLVEIFNKAGAANARNKGAQIARGKLLIFIDADILVPNNFIISHLNAHEDQNYLVAMGHRVHLAEGEHEIPLVDLKRDTREYLLQKVYKNIHNLNSPWFLSYTCNLSILRSNFLNYSFDDNFVNWGLEDVEFAYRLYQNSFNFILSNNLKCYHQYHDRNITFSKYIGWKNNLDYFIEKHPDGVINSLQIFEPVFNPSKEANYFDVFMAFENFSNDDFNEDDYLIIEVDEAKSNIDNKKLNILSNQFNKYNYIITNKRHLSTLKLCASYANEKQQVNYFDHFEWKEMCLQFDKLNQIVKIYGEKLWVH